VPPDTRSLRSSNTPRRGAAFRAAALRSEREQQNTLRPHSAFDEPRNTKGQRARLARTRARHHKDGTLAVHHGLVLLRVEFVR
jgi:hypothetical protein